MLSSNTVFQALWKYSCDKFERKFSTKIQQQRDFPRTFAKHFANRDYHLCHVCSFVLPSVRPLRKIRLPTKGSAWKFMWFSLKFVEAFRFYLKFDKIRPSKWRATCTVIITTSVTNVTVVTLVIEFTKVFMADINGYLG